MKRTFSNLALALLVCASTHAATVSTALSVNNATVTIGATGNFSISGPATLTNIGSGTFSSPSLTQDASGFSGSFTIALTGGTDSITGTLKLPTSAISGTSFTGGSLAVTGGALANAGVTGGSFPALTGSGSFGATGITLSFTGAGTIITGGTPPPPVPTITEVLNGASNTPGIAQGAIFIVKGSNLCPTGYTPFAPPRPTASGGVKITFTPTAGGTGTDAYLVYLYNPSGVSQLSGILPSTVAVGSYNVTVTNGTVSAPIAAQVVASKIGLFTQDTTGSGLANLQNYMSPGVFDVNRLTTGVFNGSTASPAKPGQTLIAWGTGLGGYAAGDNTASPAFDFSKTMNIQAVVGGVSIPVAYAGRNGYAGEDQINFTLPANIPTGCTVTLQISVNGNLSAPLFIAIAPDASATACVAPGYTTEQLKNFDNGGSLTTGAFGITQVTIADPSQGTLKSNSIGGSFSKITGFQLASASQGDMPVIQSGSCQVFQSTTGGTTSGGGTATTLDAGAVTINGPAGSSLTNQALTKTNNFYSLTNIEGSPLPGQTSFSLPAGTYTLNGAGGNDVGSFNTSITLGSPLTLSSPLPATVTRSAGLTLDWTGGNASDLVYIIGGSSSAAFFCITTAGQRTFTVPASILTQLPVSTTGSLTVTSGVTPVPFTASLKAGGSIDAGAFTSSVGIVGTPAYQ